MGINTIQNDTVYRQQKDLYPVQAHQKQPVSDADSKAAAKAADHLPLDEYISSKKSPEKPSGLYRVVPDESGNPKVLYDDPKKVQEYPPGDKEEPCTTNTDSVDREIEKLKEKQKQLKQQINAASKDEEKVRELRKKLAAVEQELQQKDNDAYRRQNASVS